MEHINYQSGNETDSLEDEVPPVPGVLTSASDPDAIYRGAMTIVEGMYQGVHFLRQQRMNEAQRKSITQIFTGAIQLVSNTQNWVRQFINRRTTSYARQQLDSEVEIEGQVFKYLEDNNCVYVLGCDELEHEKNLYDERSWNEYLLQCEGLNLWKASEDPNVVQMVNQSFVFHNTRMGRPNERLPSRIGILLYLMELSFTGVPSYELEPSSAPFYSIVESLYGNVVAERIKMVNEYLEGNLTVAFDKRGNIASITRHTVAPNQKKSISYGLDGTIKQILGDFPVRGDFSSQIRQHTRDNNMSAVDILRNPTLAYWSQAPKLAIARDEEVREETTRQKKLRKLDGGRRTNKRNKRRGKSHKKHRKSNKKSSRKRSRK